ncbi:hypothetical protein Tco_1549879, partial [Tanacetum coccineum]
GGKKDSNTVTRSVDSSSTRNDEHANTKTKGMSSDDPTGSIAKKICEEGADIGKQTSGDSSQTVNVPINSSWPISFVILLKGEPSRKTVNFCPCSKDGMNAMIENDACYLHELLRSADSDNEVDEVFNKTTGSMTSTSLEVNKSGSGVGNKVLYEQCKKTYNEDPYDDDDFDDCGLTNAQMKFAIKFDISFSWLTWIVYAEV